VTLRTDIQPRCIIVVTQTINIPKSDYLLRKYRSFTEPIIVFKQTLSRIH